MIFMNFDKKFKIFLEVAEVLNKHGIIPTLYGSLGLYRLVGQLDEIDDIDIVIPEIYAKEKLNELINIMEDIGYKQDKTFPHEFFKDKEQIGFELEEELKEFAGVDLDNYKITKVNNAEFRELSLSDYLKFYSKALKERENKIRKTKTKIEVLEKLLKHKKENNFAFIDSQNAHKGTKKDLGWGIDWTRFRVYLKHKYSVTNAYLFIGFIPEHNDIYDELQKAGFVLKFKPVLPNEDKGVKGNVDADLVLQAMIDYKDYDKAVLVSSDGDFYSLARYLYDNKKLAAVLSPCRRKCSSLLRKSAKDMMVYMDKLEGKLAKRKGTA